MGDPSNTWPHFRLDFEQQQKRAKDLLKAARAGDAQALSRFANHPPKLAEAQFLIARELRFPGWAAMKQHIAAMRRELQDIGHLAAAGEGTGTAALDADMPTLHIRCGSDIRQRLQSAGFRGDFLEHGYPYLAGPVREGPGCLEQRARFLVGSYGADRDPPLEYTAVLVGLERDERHLHDSARYERVVIWSEADAFDQLVLLRLLGHYAAHARPLRIELVSVESWPGAVRFIGLGQLPPEALRLLWTKRHAVTTAQLSLGLAGWKALASDDPRALAALMRTGTPALPLLAPALHRHLQELPGLRDGLGLTQRLALRLIGEEPRNLMRIFGALNYQLDPLPGQGDLQMRDRVLPMGDVPAPLLTHESGVDGEGRARPPWTDVLKLTDHGRAVLQGNADFLAQRPPSRWVGGVEIGAGRSDWRWDEARREVVLRKT
jgi:hypothetical protein